MFTRVLLCLAPQVAGVCDIGKSSGALETLLRERLGASLEVAEKSKLAALHALHLFCESPALLEPFLLRFFTVKFTTLSARGAKQMRVSFLDKVPDDEKGALIRKLAQGSDDHCQIVAFQAVKKLEDGFDEAWPQDGPVLPGFLGRVMMRWTSPARLPRLFDAVAASDPSDLPMKRLVFVIRQHPQGCCRHWETILRSIVVSQSGYGVIETNCKEALALLGPDDSKQ
jgi:hypothetical protein